MFESFENASFQRKKEIISADEIISSYFNTLFTHASLFV